MADLKAVQQRLNDLGYGPLVVDGLIGPMTTSAVTQFQTDKGLSVDGKVGPQTLGALGLSTIPPAGKPAQPQTNWLIPVAAPGIPGIAQSVVDAFTPVSIKFEGYTPYPYTDSKGKVTTAIGNLIDPIGSALGLAWTINGRPATQAEITADWNKVKAAWPGTQSTASQNLSQIRLSQSAIAKLVNDKMRVNDAVLIKRYPQYHNWPAAAQLFMHSTSWAWGPAFSSVWGQDGLNFDHEANSLHPDFEKMAGYAKDASQHEESINHGIIPRDAMNWDLLDEASQVLSRNLSTSKLFYPMPVGSSGGKLGLAIGIATTIGAGLAYYKWGR